MTRPWYAELSVLLSQVVQQGGKHPTQIVADGTERGWPQRIHISNSQRKSSGGGGGGDLDLIVNYLDKIRSFSFVFVRLI